MATLRKKRVSNDPPQHTPLIGRTGRAHDGNALAYNVAPARDLRPWVGWFAATHAEKPDNEVLEGGILGDHAAIRVCHGGTWTALTADGPRVFAPGEKGMALYFGPQSKVMRTSVDGSFKVISIYLGVGGAQALGAPAQSEIVDRVMDFDELMGRGHFASLFDFAAPPQVWYDTFARDFGRYFQEVTPPRPDRIALEFETCTLADPDFTLQDFAEANDVSIRTVERVVRKAYGLTPKQVMRRARALDLAAALMGVAMSEEEAEMKLRYFDQSHQIREIRHFFDRTPRQLREESNPLLMLNLEIRQSRRMEALKHLSPDKPAPWRDPRMEIRPR